MSAGGTSSTEAEAATKVETTTAAGRDASPDPSGPGREATAGGGTPEPVEPAETAPGRAGRQVAADSTSAKPEPKAAVAEEPATGSSPDGRDAPDDRDAPDGRGDDTSPAGPRPEPQGREADGETVTVIVGARRFHDSDCPLVKGASIGGSGIETMSRAEAEKAGLSNCPICRIDRRT
ncbi:hypothetical protein [Streptosporangium vulgare]|uniref:hypothetical protein n=1 Tax=Streptosporangium vulgare TaxID=46190 RepID=UPI0031E1E90C